MATSPVDEMMYRFMNRYSALLGDVRKEIVQALPYITKWNAERVIGKILAKSNMKKTIAKELLDESIRMVSIAAETPVDSIVAKDALLSKAWSPDKTLFSSKVNELSRLDEVLKTLRIGMTRGQAMNDIAVKIFKTGVQKGDVTGLINQLSNTSRLAARNAGDISLQRNLMREVNTIQAQVDRLTNPDTSTLRRAYQNVIDAAERMNTSALQKATDYAIYFKQKYNAARIADTEFARAYGNTRIAEANYDPDVTCIKVMLSSSHHIKDICDFYANADLYGRGNGIFPKDRLPDFPFHPHCHCILDYVYEIEAAPASEADFNPNAGKSYLRSLSASDRRMILGVDNSKEFADAPNTWEKLVRGYEHPTRQKILLPEGAF